MAKGLFFRGRGELPFGAQVATVRQLLERLMTPGVPLGTPA
jgi:nitronate monooxygenase